jgi:hypothetical protein
MASRFPQAHRAVMRQPRSQACKGVVDPKGTCPGRRLCLQFEAERTNEDAVFGAVEPESDHAANCYSITSSARSKTEVGMSRPKFFAARKLSTNSNFVGRSIGSSAGLVPFNTLPTMTPVWRYMSRRLTP